MSTGIHTPYNSNSNSSSEDPSKRNNSDNTHQHSHLQKFSWAGALVTLGIIYGDIGTSPLYVMKAISGTKPVDEMLILGGLSCVFWTLTLQTTIKYIILTLKADNNGEGGVFSLYALVRRRSGWLSLPAIIGGSALLADGMITPPISVASAIEGLRIVYPDIPTVPIVIGIIIFLFFIQRFGTERVGSTFGPVMTIWFSMLLILGATSITQHPMVLMSLNPYYAYNLLVIYPHGFWLLGAVFLCTTGAEALYSDLGHCGRDNIRVSWVFVKTALLVNYLGQGAWMMTQLGKPLSENPFFAIMPSWFLFIGIGIATSAAIIASQALISGSFTLISEAINLELWPKVRIRYPGSQKGQLYVGSLNWILLLGCILVVLYFRESSNMEAAYGLAITLTMMMTTVLLVFYLRTVQGWAKLSVAALASLYMLIELSFFVANLEKFPHGGWFSVAIGGVFALVMLSRRRARQIIGSLKEFVRFSPYLEELNKLSADENVDKYSTHLVYMTSSNSKKFIEEKIIGSIFGGKPKRADFYWFVNVQITDQPHGMKYKIEFLKEHQISWVTFFIGFREELRIDYLFKQVLDDAIQADEIDLEEADDYQKLIGAQALGDFMFVLHDTFLSNASQLNWIDELIMDFYFFIKSITSKPEDWFGLDPSSVITEKSPVVISPRKELVLERIIE